MNTKNSHGFWPVMAALSGNALVTTLKFIGFFLTGSSTLFSEAVHSVADVLNQVLLLIGVKRSSRKADDAFSYGYANERFFWALISACSVFFIGAGVTVYSGINALVGQKAVHIEPVAFLILSVAFLVESATLWVAVREIRTHFGKQVHFKTMLRDGDPATIAVLYEDAVAVAGVLIAIVSIGLVKFTGKYYWDGIGSILIGLLLGVVAVALIDKNRRFLLRHSLDQKTKEDVIEFIEADPAIEKVLDFKSVVMDVGKYRIKCEVEINGSALMRNMYRAREMRDAFEEIDGDYDQFVRFCVDYADRVPRAIGTRVDELEARIKERFPVIRHIDMEVN